MIYYLLTLLIGGRCRLCCLEKAPNGRKVLVVRNGILVPMGSKTCVSMLLSDNDTPWLIEPAVPFTVMSNLQTPCH